MKRKTIRFFQPFLILVAICFIVIVFLFWILKEGLGVYSFVIFFLCIIYLTYWKGVRIYDDKCEFYIHFLFMKFRKRILELGEVKEIILLRKKRYMIMRNITPTAGTLKEIMDESNELSIKNNHKEHILICKSVKYDKVYKLGKFLSEYFDIAIQNKKEDIALPRKNFFSGFNPDERRIE